MPIPEQRDPEATRSRLTEWLAPRIDGATGLELSAFTGPAFTGFSNETLIFDATWTEGGHQRTQGFVVRVQPSGYTLFLEAEFETQFRLMDALGRHTEIAVPPTHWFEQDPSVLGAPFFVMTKIDGEIPADNPPYPVEGWVAEAHPEQRERLWWSGIESLARIHQVDWEKLGFGFLDRPRRGITDPLGQQIAYYEDYLAWACEGLGGRPNPIAEAALEWVKENQPPVPPEARRFLWGDARIGNMIFQDFSCAAVLDWEMATLGDPCEDVGWWLFLDRHHSEGLGMARLEGFPSHEATIARYQELTGFELDHLDYYQVFAGLRFAVIMARLAGMLIDYELLPPDSDMPTNNIPTQLLAKMLDLPPPGPAAWEASGL